MAEENTGEVLAEITKNASECVRIQRTEFKGHELIDSRIYFEDDRGEWQPTKKGLCLRPETFARFAGAAVDVCKQLGLSPGSEEE